MVALLEMVTALVAVILLYNEAIRNRFRNYATSIFLLCFVPLFCIYPVIARLTVGGAYSIVPNSEMIIYDQRVYLIYQMFCFTLLTVTAITTPALTDFQAAPGWRGKYHASNWELAYFASVIGSGVFLYVYATGLSLAEVFAASRFEWFNSPDYSPVAFVISTYLVALSPVAIFMALEDRKSRRWAGLFIIILICYGLLAKDRKWLIYIISATFAYAYIRNGLMIRFSKSAMIAGAIAATALVFWQVGRGVVFSYYITGAGDVTYEAQQVALKLLTQGDFPYYYNASITAIDLYLNFDFSIPLGLLRRQLLFFLPANFSLGLKVEDISAIFSDAIGAGDLTRRGNMPPGFFGLFVVSFGWMGGTVACSLTPMALRAIDRFIRRNRGIGSIVVTAHFMSSVILLLRGDDSSATYFIISSMMLFVAIRPTAVFRSRSSYVEGNRDREGRLLLP